MQNLAEAAIGAGVTPRSVVAAVGGGLAGNAGGLLAALLYRGVRLVHFPTTLLAMADSGAQPQTGRQHPRGAKTSSARSTPPSSCGPTWATSSRCPPAQIRAALCEMIKNVLVAAPDRYDWAAARLRPDAHYTSWELAEFTAFCVDAKQRVMRDDPHETGPALVLEYGHTLGHAIELLTPGGISHGLAVGLGMLAAARAAGELGYLTASAQHTHRVLLERAGAPAQLPYRVPARDLLDLVHHDNKRGYRQPQPGHVDMVLLDGLGSPHQEAGTYLTHVPDATAARAIISLMPPRPPKPRAPARAGGASAPRGA